MMKNDFFKKLIVALCAMFIASGVVFCNVEAVGKLDDMRHEEVSQTTDNREGDTSKSTEKKDKDDEDGGEIHKDKKDKEQVRDSKDKDEKASNAQIKKLEKELEKLRTEIDKKADVPIIPMMAVYGAVILSIVFGLAALYCDWSTRSELVGNIKELKRQKPQGNDEAVARLEQKISEMQDAISEIEKNNTNIFLQPEYEQPKPAQQKNEVRQSERPISEPQKKSDEVVRFYNEIQGLQNPNDKREQRKQFVKRFNVCSYICVNADKRMNNHTLSPEFKKTDAPIDTLWVIKIEGEKYIALPNLKSYGEDEDFAKGMSFFFDRNFISGTSYNHIKVIEPAQVDMNLHVIKRGKLELS